MSSRRDHRASRAALFDGFDSIEEGGIRVPSSYSREVDEHSNDTAINSLHDRVSFLKRLTGDIHEEVESHNRILDRMGHEMDASRGIMSGTVDRFKTVFEKKSSQRICKHVDDKQKLNIASRSIPFIVYGEAAGRKHCVVTRQIIS